MATKKSTTAKASKPEAKPTASVKQGAKTEAANAKSAVKTTDAKPAAKPAATTAAKTAAKKPAAKATAAKKPASKTTKAATAKTATTTKAASTKAATTKAASTKAATTKTASTKAATTKTASTKAAGAKTKAASTKAASAKTTTKASTAKTTSAAKDATAKPAKSESTKKASAADAASVKKAVNATAADEAKAKKEAEAKAKREAEAKAKKEAEAKAKKEAEAKAKAEAEKKAKAEAEAKAKAEAEAKAKKEAEAKAKKEAEAKAKREAEAKAKKEAEAKAKAEAEAKAAEEAARIAKAAKEKEEVEARAAAEFSDVPGVLIAAAECSPLVKVGGLADVVGALPKYLKKLGVDARVIMPLHRQIKERYFDQMEHLCHFEASLGWRSQYVGLEKLELDGAIYYFIDNEFYFGGPIYCGGEFEGEQYAFFTRAVMDSIPQLDFDVRILHCNDWHTAMMPLLAKTQYQGGVQEGLRTVLTIHNLHFQGQFSHEFDRDLLRVDDSLATPQFIEHYGCDNMLKAGIVFADKVNTVSPTYAREICEPYLGESLDGVLRSRGGDLWGILNGIDNDEWDPTTDKNLPVQFSLRSIGRKRQVRDAVLEELGLEPAGENTAVIGMVGRLTPQKGLDLVQQVLDDIMAEDVRMIVLGSGDKVYEDFLRGAEERHKGRLCSFIGYAGELSHRIYAGSDLFLMPSLFEPCGISQMIAMRYGTLPIVRETGGLVDTVTPYNEFTMEGNGFSFSNYNAYEMLNCIRYALWVWRGEPARKALIKHAMESDYGFGRCARMYAELYRTLL